MNQVISCDCSSSLFLSHQFHLFLPSPFYPAVSPSPFPPRFNPHNASTQSILCGDQSEGQYSSLELICQKYTHDTLQRIADPPPVTRSSKRLRVKEESVEPEVQVISDDSQSEYLPDDEDDDEEKAGRDRGSQVAMGRLGKTKATQEANKVRRAQAGTDNSSAFCTADRKWCSRCIAALGDDLLVCCFWKTQDGKQCVRCSVNNATCDTEYIDGDRFDVAAKAIIASVATLDTNDKHAMGAHKAACKDWAENYYAYRRVHGPAPAPKKRTRYERPAREAAREAARETAGPTVIELGPNTLAMLKGIHDALVELKDKL
ncbi:hypothetical protein ASPZODRAFT_470477 [Penicilliopsis zonata CBS 506.65]|uniref:Uncharacterized protein n=1 Tax=Penicilliopsis zonata CBS 506.65 TaxID=1073090 RepID=A0A1L9SXC6_9EURO|nr:hypothetical protein ASPZODRAFT_470477 [Penicilliopsis zonata CBS 506.65]OJJ51830.1 hypothetical protein ASPZODRAFT_470477 [Penicilliopsis zonata CBS 506.65]